MTTTCFHCERLIILEDGTWIDPEASGDDIMWRETCDEHDTFRAEHSPTDGSEDGPMNDDWIQAAYERSVPAQTITEMILEDMRLG